MSRGVVTLLPPHDGHPGMEINWAADCRQIFYRGVSFARAWLDTPRSGWLWAAMIAERDHLPRAIERPSAVALRFVRCGQLTGGFN
ncbi:hypothetical protein I0E98_18815 [Pseudomonas lalucatii]|nr:hypothetical protein [Pseudomonas lalucatii]